MTRPRKLLLGCTTLLIAVLALLGWSIFDKLYAVEYPVYDDLEENFKYASIGVELLGGHNYYIWAVLPEVFPDLLPRPGGYETFGLFWEEGHDTPIGVTKVRLGQPTVGFNCAFCHTASHREEADGVPVVYAGGPSTTLDFYSYAFFFPKVAADPRFNADTLLAAMTEEFELSWLDRLLYRFVFIPRAKQRMLLTNEILAWVGQHDRPVWGIGQLDPFNPPKFGMLHLQDDGTIGNADIMPAWNIDYRHEVGGSRAWLHWDGLANDIHEVAINSSLGSGAVAESFQWEAIDRIVDFVSRKAPPPFPMEHDAELAARGEKLFREDCASCHGPDGDRVLQVIPLAEIRTDPHRALMWTDEAAATYSAYNVGHDWNLHFFNQDGYIAETLDGVWLRGPFLHNGSVPTLWDLLQPAARRPTSFYRGLDVLDPVNVGYVSSGPDAERYGRLFDTSLPSNGNGGHEYGTALSDEDKRALIEYLKTL